MVLETEAFEKMLVEARTDKARAFLTGLRKRYKIERFADGRLALTKGRQRVELDAGPSKRRVRKASPR
jgi:hypothetical protein